MIVFINKNQKGQNAGFRMVLHLSTLFNFWHLSKHCQGIIQGILQVRKQSSQAELMLFSLSCGAQVVTLLFLDCKHGGQRSSQLCLLPHILFIHDFDSLVLILFMAHSDVAHKSFLPLTSMLLVEQMLYLCERAHLSHLSVLKKSFKF